MVIYCVVNKATLFCEEIFDKFIAGSSQNRLDVKIRAAIVIPAIVIGFSILIFLSGLMAKKYANITNKPPT